MATTRSGAPAADHAAERRGRSRRGRACAAPRARRPARAGRRAASSRVSRPAPSGSETRDVGLLVEPGGDLQRAAADVEDQQPAGDQPNHRRTARKVSRASSSPVSTCRSTPVSLADLRRAPRRRWAPRGPREVAKASSSSTPLSSATCSALVRRTPRAASAPAGGDRAVVVEVLGQPQLGLVRVRGQRRRARWASTTSRCTVLDPTSRTPSRMASNVADRGAAPCRSRRHAAARDRCSA